MDKDVAIKKDVNEKTSKADDENYEKFFDLILKKGEIRKYAKNTNLFGDYNVGYCLILNDSLKLDPRVLICPLYFKSQIENKTNIKLVKFHAYIDGVQQEVFGSLLDIRFVNKRKFIEFGDGVNKIHDEIHLEIVNKVLEIYMLLLTQMIIKSKKEQPIPC